jgi:glycosyltransferase involved in cell wall biosynthesis
MIDPRMPRAAVSFVVTVYNKRRYLAEVLAGIGAQEGSFEREVIVVDDGSDDGSGDVARAFGDAVRVVTQQRRGNGAARNRAVAEASGAYFAFLDADDRFTPEKLSRQLARLDSDQSLDMIFGWVREFVSPELDDDVKAQIRPPAPESPWAAPNLMLIRRKSFERVGPFSEELRVGVTVDWYARAVEAGLASEVLPEVVLERRLHAANNGLRERDARSQYIHVLKAAMDRRRAASASSE